MTPLEKLAAAIRDSPALASKRDLALLTRLGSPLDGDDGAAIAHGDEYLIVCGEAIHPAFVRTNPRAAGAGRSRHGAGSGASVGRARLGGGRRERRGREPDRVDPATRGGGRPGP